MSSLLDAFLLDPAPFEAWIAYRTDGIKGSLTLNDPADGSPQLAAAFQISALSKSGRVATATATGHN